MKRLIFPAVLLLLASGCRSTDSIEQLQSGRRSDCDAVTILAPSNNVLTRTTLNKDDESGVYDIYWALKDEIGVYSDWTDNAQFTLNSIGQDEVAFQGTIAGAPEFAYYPYSENAGENPKAITLNLPDKQTQTGDNNPNMAYDLKSGQKKSGSAQDGYTFEFQQKLTILMFTITPSSELVGQTLQRISLKAPIGQKLAGDYTLDITGNKAPVFWDNYSNEVILSFVDMPAFKANESVTGYMFINPDIKANDGLVITVATDKKLISTKNAKAGNDGFNSGLIYDIQMNLSNLDDTQITIGDAWYYQYSECGLYSIDVGIATSVHKYEANKDQYSYSTNGNDYSYSVQSMMKGKLSRFTAPKEAIKYGTACFSGTLYTIHDADGAVSTPGIWKEVRKDNNKYWLENSEWSKGFILTVEED